MITLLTFAALTLGIGFALGGLNVVATQYLAEVRARLDDGDCAHCEQYGLTYKCPNCSEGFGQ